MIGQQRQPVQKAPMRLIDHRQRRIIIKAGIKVLRVPVDHLVGTAQNIGRLTRNQRMNRRSIIAMPEGHVTQIVRAHLCWHARV